MNQQSSTFSKLVIDKIKKNDLKQIFEILMILPSNRTIADLNTLAKIILNIQPIKEIKNFSAIYHCCKSMYLAKYKEKDFIFQKKQQSEALYIVLNGKVGLYKRSNEQYESEEVVFLDEGSCFGKLFNWKVRFLPLALQETLIAILPKRQFNKIGIVVNIQKQLIIKEIKNAGIIPLDIGQQKFRSISHTFVINRVPHGHYLIKSGQTPKVIFLILKGMVKKVIEIPSKDKTDERNKGILEISNKTVGDGVKEVLQQNYTKIECDNYSMSHYSTGDYFPKTSMNSPVNYSLITQCPSQIVTLPKKALKSIGYYFNQQKGQQNKGSEYYQDQLGKQKEWIKYKGNIVGDVIKFKELRKTKGNFR